MEYTYSQKKEVVRKLLNNSQEDKEFLQGFNDNNIDGTYNPSKPIWLMSDIEKAIQCSAYWGYMIGKGTFKKEDYMPSTDESIHNSRNGSLFVWFLIALFAFIIIAGASSFMSNDNKTPNQIKQQEYETIGYPRY